MVDSIANDDHCIALTDPIRKRSSYTRDHFPERRFTGEGLRGEDVRRSLQRFTPGRMRATRRCLTNPTVRLRRVPTADSEMPSQLAVSAGESPSP